MLASPFLLRVGLFRAGALRLRPSTEEYATRARARGWSGLERILRISGESGRAEAVAHVPHGLDVARAARFRLDLGAQVRDVAVEQTGAALGFVAPDACDELVAGQDPPGLGRQRGQQLELGPGQAHRATLDRHFAGAEVDAQAAEHELLAGRGGLGGPRRAAQHRPDAGDQLARAEWLGDVVVGSQLQPDHLVDLVAAGGQDDDRQRRVALVHRAADLETARAG